MENGVGQVGGGLLQRILGEPTTTVRSGDAPSAPSSLSPPSLRRSSPSWGERGMRMLPADFPLDRLDRSAPRGTYIDLLI